MATATAGALRTAGQRRPAWGRSCVLRACDDALAGSGVRRGDYLVVERGRLPAGDGLVIVRACGDERKTGLVRHRDPAQSGRRLLLRMLERYGERVRLQPGGGPLRPLLQSPEGAGVWGTVVAVLRKFSTEQQ